MIDRKGFDLSNDQQCKLMTSKNMTLLDVIAV